MKSDQVTIILKDSVGCLYFFGKVGRVKQLALTPYIIFLFSLSFSLHTFSVSPNLKNSNPVHYLLASIYLSLYFSSAVTYITLKVGYFILRATSLQDAENLNVIDARTVNWKRIESILTFVLIASTTIALVTSLFIWRSFFTRL